MMAACPLIEIQAHAFQLVDVHAVWENLQDGSPKIAFSCLISGRYSSLALTMVHGRYNYSCPVVIVVKMAVEIVSLLIKNMIFDSYVSLPESIGDHN